MSRLAEMESCFDRSPAGADVTVVTKADDEGRKKLRRELLAVDLENGLLVARFPQGLSRELGQTLLDAYGHADVDYIGVNTD